MFKNNKEEKSTYLPNSFRNQLQQIMTLAYYLTCTYQKTPGPILIKKEDQKELKLEEKEVATSIRMAAPEILAKNFLKRNEKSDVFSFGVLCYSLITGKVPYDGLDAQKISAFVQGGRRLDISENCFSGRYSFIQHCWAQDPEDRPSIAHILAYLESCVSADIALLLADVEPYVLGYYDSLESYVSVYDNSPVKFNKEFLDFKWISYPYVVRKIEERSLFIEDARVCEFLNEGFSVLIGEKIHGSQEANQIIMGKATKLSFSQERILVRLEKLLQERTRENNGSCIEQGKKIEIIESKRKSLEKKWREENTLETVSFVNSLANFLQIIKDYPVPTDIILLPYLSDNVLSCLLTTLLFRLPHRFEELLDKIQKENIINLGSLSWTDIYMGLSDHSGEEVLVGYITSRKIKLIQELVVQISLVRANSPLAFDVALKQGMSFDQLLVEILRWDSFDIFDKFYRYWITTKQNRINSNTDMLDAAIVARALRCIKILLQINAETEGDKKIKEMDIIRRIEIAADEGDSVTVLVLCKDDFIQAVNYMFSEKLFSGKYDEKLKILLLTMLRFTDIGAVNKMVEIFLSSNRPELQRDLLRKSYFGAKENFYFMAPFFSRYSKLVELEEIKKVYNRTINEDKDEKNGNKLEKWCRQDMEYGKKRRELALYLYQQLTTSTLKCSLDSGFNSLAALPMKTQRVAALLESISTWSHNDQKTSINNDFNEIRREGFQTLVAGRYGWSEPLIRAVFHHSQSKYIIKTNKYVYSLTYCKTKKTNNATEEEKLILNNIDFKISPNKITKRLAYYHGREQLTKTWKDIEDLFETIWPMDLKKPDEYANLEKKEAYQKNLTEFYSTVAELVWLIGNTQPMNRGSGTFVELIFAIVHIHHNLQPPILKLEFPQLDVLNLTFPLSDYKYFFPYFFEPDTIPEHLRRMSAMRSLSVYDQMKLLYKELNQSLSFEEKPQSSQSRSTERKIESSNLDSYGIFSVSSQASTNERQNHSSITDEHPSQPTH